MNHSTKSNSTPSNQLTAFAKILNILAAPKDDKSCSQSRIDQSQFSKFDDEMLENCNRTPKTFNRRSIPDHEFDIKSCSSISAISRPSVNYIQKKLPNTINNPVMRQSSPNILPMK